jgi:site-specific recombinase XerD
MFLPNGGNVPTLQQLLGRTNFTMTSRYLAISQDDIARQHR